MAVTASDSEINQAPNEKTFIIMITKSLQKLANGFAGRKRNLAGNGRVRDGRCKLTATVIPVRTDGRLKSSFKRASNQNRIRRGQIKIKMFKMIAKSLKDLAIMVAGGKKKAAGNRRCNFGCFSSPATVIPVVTVEEFESTSEGEIKQHKPKRGNIKIKNWKKINEAIIQISESTEKKVSGGDRVPRLPEFFQWKPQVTGFELYK